VDSCYTWKQKVVEEFDDNLWRVPKPTAALK